MEPDDLVGLRPGRDGALEVDVVALGDVVRIEAGAKLQPHHGGICSKAHISVERSDVMVERRLKIILVPLICYPAFADEFGTLIHHVKYV